jgi:peptidyl-prolyl cis-trans isomerase A (cyclophilin A)
MRQEVNKKISSHLAGLIAFGNIIYNETKDKFGDEMKFLIDAMLVWKNKLRITIAGACLFGSVLVGQLSFAQTIVNVETNAGNFSIELFDTTAPATVANFLSYVNSGRYNGTVFHRSVPGFIIQGGGFLFDSATQTFPAINLDPAVVNEFSLSNARGTLAMAKVAGNPNSATSQWFVNLINNAGNLDNQNGGFTVFGRVIEPGMTVVDAISNLERFNLGDVVSEIPLAPVTGDDGTVVSRSVISMQMSVSAPPEPIISNSYDQSTGLLKLKVAVDNTDFLGLSFVVDSLDPQIVIRALADSIVPESAGDASFATFSSADGSLLVQKLYINGAVAFRNARFTLTDGARFLFTLQSVD